MKFEIYTELISYGVIEVNASSKEHAEEIFDNLTAHQLDQIFLDEEKFYSISHIENNT